jgi:hypothetical protein
MEKTRVRDFSESCYVHIMPLQIFLIGESAGTSPQTGSSPLTLESWKRGGFTLLAREKTWRDGPDGLHTQMGSEPSQRKSFILRFGRPHHEKKLETLYGFPILIKQLFYV